MIIGLTGTLAAGKGTLAEFLKEEGFVYLSLSDELRQIAKENKTELTRKNLQDLGNRLRREEGSGILGQLVYDKIKNQYYSKAIVDGIRNPAEIKTLRALDDYFLVSVDAPLESRFERMKKRNRESDPKTLEEFLLVDNRDKGIGEKETGQGVAKCMEQADFALYNDGSLEEMQKKVKDLYRKIESQLLRPSWDEYFMKQAALVAERSTCLRHHVGAVIVRDKRTITTGYNGAGMGKISCKDEGVCLRDKLGILSGQRHEICRAIHAEQNAIIQGAYHGISLKGGTIYSTHTPCIICAKMILNAGLERVVSYHGYADEEAKEYLEESGIKLDIIKRPRGIISFKD